MEATPTELDAVGVRFVAEPAEGYPAHDPPAAASLILVSRSGEASQELGLGVPGEVVANLPRGSAWLASLHSKDSWSPAQDIELGSEDSETAVRFEVVPAGEVGAVLRWNEQVDPPSALEARFEPMPGSIQNVTDDVGPKGSTTCPLDKGRLLCPLPAGTFDLRFSAEGFVPLYAWGVGVAPRATTELGRLRLTKGGSIIGWIEAPGREINLEEVALELTPRLAATTDATSRERYRLLALDGARVDERGFFQIAGIKPGAYTLLARHPTYAPTRIDGLEITADEEIELGSVLLEEPARLEVEIYPRLSPFSRPWTLRLTTQTMENGFFEVVGEATANKDGRWSLGGLAAGQYRVEVGDGRNGRWAIDAFDLFPGENYRTFELPFVRLEGRLLLDDEPIEGARVELRQHQGNTRVTVTSRDEGRFYAFLAKDAEWDVEVRHQSEGIGAFFERITVPERERGERWPKRDFEIPNTRIFGEIVDSEGRRIEESIFVDVDGVGSSWLLQRPTSDGRFEVRGLPEGDLRLQARSDPARQGPGASSAKLETQLREGVVLGPLQLVLQESLQLSGIVVGPTGEGVPGVKVMGLPERIDGRHVTTWFPQTATDMDGLFELDVPRASRFVQLSVFPPGFAATQLRVEVASAPETGMIVQVEHVGGTITIEYEPSDEGSWNPTSKRWTTLWGVDSGWATVQLTPWAKLHAAPSAPTRMVIPMLSPGGYQACFGAEALEFLATGQAPSGDVAARHCVGGELAPGGELVLRLPSQALVLPEDSQASAAPQH